MIIFFGFTALQSSKEHTYNKYILDTQLESLCEQHRHPERFGENVDKWLNAFGMIEIVCGLEPLEESV